MTSSNNKIKNRTTYSIKNTIIICILLCSLSAGAQNIQYASPVDFNIALAGNVGEIRAGHFHTGIDIKSPVGIGPAIKATATGYITRIGVSPVGYGNVLYVSHLDGTTSVYAHLNGFARNIADWVRQQQYAKKTFNVDLYPPSNLFPVKQGDLIGYLGNSGSSGGPHLHFEIRDAASNPLNIVANKTFKVADNIAPEVYRATIFECDTINGAPIFTPTQSIDIKQDKRGVWRPASDIFYASRPFYIAYELIDFMNGRSNTLGVYSLTQKVNGRPNFSFCINKLSFASTRYVNSFTEWIVPINSRSTTLRAYVSPNNKLKIYDNIVNNGIISAPKTGDKTAIETSILDNNGNVTTLNFIVEIGTKTNNCEQIFANYKKADWDKDFVLNTDMAQITIPAGALYETALINVEWVGDWVNIESSDERPLQKDIILKINDLTPFEMQSKALIINSRGQSIGGQWVGKGVEARSEQFGKFSVAYDTIPPKITYAGISNGYIKFRVTDNLSGVKNYQLTIDGQWALGEYDAKSGTIAYKFSFANTPKNHKVELYISDSKNNSNKINITEKW